MLGWAREVKYFNFKGNRKLANFMIEGPQSRPKSKKTTRANTASCLDFAPSEPCMLHRGCKPTLSHTTTHCPNSVFDLVWSRRLHHESAPHANHTPIVTMLGLSRLHSEIRKNTVANSYSQDPGSDIGCFARERAVIRVCSGVLGPPLPRFRGVGPVRVCWGGPITPGRVPDPFELGWRWPQHTGTDPDGFGTAGRTSH